MTARGFEENVSLDEGTDAYGIRTHLHFEGDEMITQKTYDAEPLLREAAAVRQQTDGQRRGEMRRVATVPMAVYQKFILIKDNKDRQKAIRDWLRENSQFVMYDRYLKR